MKIRSDFVTNSSSSSFLVITLKSSVLAKILLNFLEDINKYSYISVAIDGDIVNISTEDAWEAIPDTIEDISNSIVKLISNQVYIKGFDRETEEEFYRMKEIDFSSEGKETDIYDKHDRICRKIALEVLKYKDKICESIESGEWTEIEEAWGGCNDSRYYRSSYTDEELSDLFDKISKAYGIPKEYISDENMEEYVCDKSAVKKYEATFKKGEKVKVRRIFTVE